MKILVGFDANKNNTKHLDLAQKHAAAHQAEVVIFTASGHSPELHTKKLNKLQSRLQEIQDDFKDAGIPCETHIAIRSLSPGEDLVEYAKIHDIDEIVIGVTRRSKIGKLIMGSTAQFIILEAPCPVVTIK